MIPNRWYLNTDINPIDMLQQHSSMPICKTTQLEDTPMLERISLDQFLLIRNYSDNTLLLPVKSTKMIYAELSGISKKAIDYAIKTDMQKELSDMIKTFIYNVQCKIDNQEIENLENLADINNPAIIRHKGRPPKRFKANVEQSSSKGKRVLKDSTQVNVMVDAEGLNAIEDETKGRKCGKCKQYGHYAKTCQNI